MPEYIGLGDETDPDDIADDAFDYLQGYFPEWEPNEGNLDTILLKGQAEEASVHRSLAAETSTAIFRRFGETAGLPPQDPTEATGESTWTVIDDAGYTIPANTQIGLTGLDGTLIGFRTLEDVTILSGDTVTATGEVAIEAIEPGADGTGLTGDIELIDALDYVVSATVEGTTSGGSDGETDAEYIDRLSSLLTLQTARPILPDDFALLAQNQIEGVYRATAIDLYNADTDTEGVERCVTVGVVGEDGEAVSSTISDEVDELLQSEREVNFLVFVIDPTYTTIDANYTFEPLTGYDADEVAGRVDSAIDDWLNPANWGATTNDPQAWVNNTTVRVNELIALVSNVQGVDYVTGAWLAEEGDTPAAVDVEIAGPVALTRAGTITNGAP